MAQAIRDAYGDLLLIKEHPMAADRSAIEGKFKSFHNVSENLATQMASTFFGLLALADMTPGVQNEPRTKQKAENGQGEGADKPADDEVPKHKATRVHHPSLHYNVQIHLPATKDVEVYNAIFKSLKDHLLAE